MKTRVFVDTSSDLTFDQAKELGVELIELPVNFSGEAFHQGNPEDFSHFYEKMEDAPELPVTSQPVFGDMVQLFQEIKDAGQEAVYVTISSGISGTYPSMLKAKEIVGYDGIEIVDSLTCLPQVALMAMRMGKKAKEGLSAKEIAEDIEAFKMRTFVCENLTELTNLKKGGRIPDILAALSTLFRVVPFLIMDKEGKLVSPVKDRGVKNSFKRIVSYITRYPLDYNYPIIIQYTSNKEEGEKLYEMVKAALPEEAKLLIRPVGPVVGTHLGNNSVGASYALTEEGKALRDEDLARNPKAPFRMDK